MTKNKKKIQNEISSLIEEYKNENTQSLVDDYQSYMIYIEQEKELEQKKNALHNIYTHVEYNINQVIGVLIEHEFVNSSVDADPIEDIVDSVVPKDISRNGMALLKITKKGKLASRIQEVNCLMVSNILVNGLLDDLTVTELVGVLSCFVELGIPEDKRVTNPQYCCSSGKVCHVLSAMNESLGMYIDIQYDLNLIVDKALCFDIQDHIMNWCDVTNETECKEFLNDIYVNDIFLGEFVKAILKINNVVNELQYACEVTENIELKQKLTQIPGLTLKFVATNQSLYI
jgi:hypothetical protein